MTVSLILPILVALATLLVILFVLWVLIQPLLALGSVRSASLSSVVRLPLAWSEGRALDRYGILLQRAQRASQAQDRDVALKNMEQAFFLDTIRYDSQLIDRAHDHNMRVLQLFLPLVRDTPGSRVHMATVEGLAQTRTALLARLFDLKNAEAGLISRRRSKGTPSWGLSDFQARRADTVKLLAENVAELRLALSKLVASLKGAGSSSTDGITVH